jgi:hypothetical protein
MIGTTVSRLINTFLLCAFVTTVHGQGWQPEQKLYAAPPGQPDQKQSCGQMPSTTILSCVFEAGLTGNLHIFEIQSSDGGVTWSGSNQITNDTNEFDPFVAVDSSRGVLWMVYSRNDSPGNDLIIRQKACASCSWSAPVTIIADGANHWDASLLVAGNGDLLALEQLEGTGGNGNWGMIRSLRSSDGGNTWQSPNVIYDGPGEELFPRAVQKTDGVIHLMFRVARQYPFLQIGQVWSGDYGYTWTGYSVFQYSFSQDQEFTFLGSQGGQNETAIASIGGYVNHWVSWDNGNTWSGPNQVSAIAGGEDGEMAMGCRGPVFTFDDHSMNAWERRYDWYTSCQ